MGEGTEADMKRIVVLLTVVALMLVVMATSVPPAFAGGWVATEQRDPQLSIDTYVYCRAGDKASFIFTSLNYDYSAVDANANRFVCLRGGDPDRPYDDKTDVKSGWVGTRQTDTFAGGTPTIYCRTGDDPAYVPAADPDHYQQYLAADRNFNRFVCLRGGDPGDPDRPYDDRIF
jgi:hypothetical protein